MDLTYIIDFDSTLVSVESLDELARIGMADAPDADRRMAQFHELTARGMSGSMPFDESLWQRIALLNADRTHINQLAEILKDEITDSALELIDWFTENADSIYVISGGFEEYIIPVVEELGISKAHVFANRFTYDENGVITGVDSSSLLSQPQGKVAQVAALELPKPVIMIGDGIVDYEVRARGEANEFWAFTQHAARPSVVERADRVLTSFEELEELAELIA